MPIVMGVDHENRQVNAVAIGPVTFADVESHLSAERHFGGLPFKELIDARGASFVWAPKEVQAIVEIVRGMSKEEKFGPTAVLVSTDDSFGAIRMLELSLDGVAEVKPFRNEQEARAWLASC